MNRWEIKIIKMDCIYKGDGTEHNPFTFRCAEETKLTSTFINRVLGYNKTGEKRINDGVYVRLEIRDPQTAEGLIEAIKINGTQKHDPYPPTYSFLFTKNGLQEIIEKPIEEEVISGETIIQAMISQAMMGESLTQKKS